MSRGIRGVAHLRRDGFASLHASAGRGSGALLTHPLRYSSSSPPWDPLGLWLNLDASAAGASLKIKLLKDGEIVAHSELISGASADSTKLLVRWADGDPMGAISAGAEFQLRFYLSGGAQLFAFWLSNVECGASGGFVAAGGAGYAMGRDTGCPQ